MLKVGARLLAILASGRPQIFEVVRRSNPLDCRSETWRCSLLAGEKKLALKIVLDEHLGVGAQGPRCCPRILEVVLPMLELWLITIFCWHVLDVGAGVGWPRFLESGAEGRALPGNRKIGAADPLKTESRGLATIFDLACRT